MPLERRSYSYYVGGGGLMEISFETDETERFILYDGKLTVSNQAFCPFCYSSQSVFVAGHGQVTGHGQQVL